jgi:hypothetical protein
LHYCIWKKQDSKWIDLLLLHEIDLEKPVLMSEFLTSKKSIPLQKWMKQNELDKKNPKAYKKIMAALKSKKSPECIFNAVPVIFGVCILDLILSSSVLRE